MSKVESVKVAVRVRPYNAREKEANSTCIIRVRDSLPRTETRASHRPS